MDDLGANAVANVFDMLVARLSNVEESIAWIARTNAITAPSGTMIPGALFGVPFDVLKCYGSESPLRLRVELIPRDSQAFDRAMAQTPEVRMLTAVMNESIRVMFCSERASFTEAIDNVLEFLKAKSVDPGALKFISLQHVELPEMHRLFYEANRPDPVESKHQRLRKIVATICKDKARGKLIREWWRDTHRAAMEMNVEEEEYECVFRAFEPHIGELGYE